MGAYLTDHPPAVQQWYTKRSRPLTGCTVLHTAESVMDSVGPDTGAEAVAEFIRGRTTPGSYHDLVDSDSWIRLVDLAHGAFHDGTGSNNWALSISFACATSDWRAMSPARRAAFLAQGAAAFVAQQTYRRAIGAPLTELRLISKAQSDRGESGFTFHGLRDPGRRSDPGVKAPNLFPIEEWLAACRAALNPTPPATPPAPQHDTQEDTVYIRVKDPQDPQKLDAVGLYSGGVLIGLYGAEVTDAVIATNNFIRIPGSAPFQWVNRPTWDLMDRRGQQLVGDQVSAADRAMAAQTASALGAAVLAAGSIKTT